MKALALALLALPAGAVASSWEARAHDVFAELRLPEAVRSISGRRPAAPRAAQASGSVALAPLLDRHLHHTEQLSLPGGGVLKLAGTLGLSTDGDEDAYFSVITPGGQRHNYLLNARTGGRFTVNGRAYEVDLEINIFRDKHDNVLVIKDASGRAIWRRTIRQLFRASYLAGRQLHLHGREYRLFYTHDIRTRAPILCFVHDTPRKYHFFIFPVTAMQRAATSYTLYNGEQIRLQVSPDRSTLLINP